jgi:hypothetical protein
MLCKSEQHVIFEWVTTVRPVDTSSVVKKPAVVGDTETASTGINSPAWIEFLHTLKRSECVGIALDQLVVTPCVFADRTEEGYAAKGNTHFPYAYFAILLVILNFLFIYFRNKFIVASRINSVHMLLYWDINCADTHYTETSFYAKVGLNKIYILCSIFCVMSYFLFNE